MTTAPALAGRARTPAALELTRNYDWRDDSACRHEDPELHFPIGNTGPALLQIEEAKAVCRRCPVVEECLNWALETKQESGVWGGLSEDERYALRGRTRSRRLVNGLSHTDNIIQNRLAEFRELESSGLDDLGIARKLGTNVQTILRVRSRLAARAVFAEEVNAA